MAGEIKNILLVDDERLNLDMLSRRLQRSGFDVRLAENGYEALDLLDKVIFDLVLLDHMMPGMSGPETLVKIRERFTQVELPVIMVTAVAESDKIVKALEAGANDYVTKPIDYQVALARIRVQLDRRDAEVALRISEKRYALASEAARDGLWDWDLVNDNVFLSSRWMEMVGMPSCAAQVLPDVWLSRVFTKDLDKVLGCVAAVRSGSADTLHCEYRLLDTHGHLRWMSSRAIVTRGDHGEAMRLSGSQSDITKERTCDTLTGLENRLAVISRLEQLFLAQQERPGCQKSYGVLFLDLDGFKVVNDSLGHLAGDQLLCFIADRLREAVAHKMASPGSLTKKATIARMGGDEFAILLESPAADVDAAELGELVQQSMLQAVPLADRAVHCAFSIGIAVNCDEHTTAQSILNDADVAMYSAKASGRGRVAVFTAEMRCAALDRLELESDLCDATERGELRVLYQPKVRLDSAEIYGVEALVRWEHPVRGTISPAVFIPLAEQTGAIASIGRWVLRSACSQVARWHELFPNLASLELSVNLSPAEFREKDLVQRIKQTLEEVRYPPHLLHLEVTENVLFTDMESARTTLQELQRLGILLDLDDFGSGYSSLRYLRELPFHTLKIDRYFISALDSGSVSSVELIHTILTMAAALDLDVVAEGIEQQDHRSALQKMGCRYGQGYYFSKPVTAQELEPVLLQQNAERQSNAQPDTGKQRGFSLGFGLAEAAS